jgi:hypothetical protein
MMYTVVVSVYRKEYGRSSALSVLCFDSAIASAKQVIEKIREYLLIESQANRG